MGLEPGRRIGAYEIVGPLGSGGMGEVYRGRDTRLGRPVAIKLVSGEVATDATAHERLEREARLTSSLNHPNIVTVYDVGDVDGQPFIVMELIDGETLHARLAARRLRPKEAVGIAVQVADGLAAAHGAGVVHRDLKPRNIMITGEGRVKILDFGLGKVAQTAALANDPTIRVPDLTDSHAVVGTAGYMAPEQVSVGRIDHRTDQFALGTILYEMLTGERAFRRDTPIQTMAAVLEHEPTPVLEIFPTAPPELAAIVQRCLEKDPARRYASTVDLARDLEDARAAFTASPWPTPRPLPSAPSAGRGVPASRWAVALGGAVAVALLALAWQWTSGPDSRLDEARALLYRWDEPANVDRAVQLLSSAVAAGPLDPIVRTSLAEAYVRQYEYTQDASLIDRAGVEIATALGQADLAPAHVVQAMIDNAQGRYDAALAAANRALAVNNRSADAYREIGRAHLRQNRLDEAAEELTRAVSLNSADWSARHHLAVVYYTSGRYDEAVEAWRRTLDLAPSFTRALNNLGGALIALGRFDEGTDALRRAAEQGRSPSAYANLGQVYYSRGRFEEAVREYEKAVEMPSATAEHWRNLGAASHWMPGMEARSTEAYGEAVRLGEQQRYFEKQNPQLLSTLADAYAVLDRDSEALATLAELEKLGPTDKEVLYTIASVYEQLGNRDTALDWLGKAKDAGKSLDEVERSPWLKDLVKDQRYLMRFKQQ